MASSFFHRELEAGDGVRLFEGSGGYAPGEQRRDIVSVFEAVGLHASKKISDEDLERLEACAIPGAGACGGMYTANTMASAIEALGMSLPNSSAQIAISEEKKQDCRRAGEATLALLKADLKPRDIMTRKAFENAIRVNAGIGGKAAPRAEAIDRMVKDCGMVYAYGVTGMAYAAEKLRQLMKT